MKKLVAKLGNIKATEGFMLHPEDPQYLREFLEDAKEKVKNEDISMVEMSGIKNKLTETGIIPGWYVERFGKDFEQQNELVLMGGQGEEVIDESIMDGSFLDQTGLLDRTRVCIKNHKFDGCGACIGEQKLLLS